MIANQLMPRLVVVEDHAVVRELLGPRISEEIGLTLVAEASTVAEAKVICLREKPDLVIADWTLPDGSSADLVVSVTDKLPKTKWLFVSAFENRAMVEEAAALGAGGFVLKKWPVTVLLEAVEVASNSPWLGDKPYFFIKAKI